jgi:uncharacterized protein
VTAEWPATLDVDGLIAEGWRPTPFREFCLKIHSRCDLACDYCYMYEMADQSWRGRPARMSRDTLDHAAGRIAEHVRVHRLPSVKVILHGGEPLLAGPERLEYAVTAVRGAVRDAVGTAATVEAGIQTNGVRLDDAYLRLFADLGVRVGISLDGAAAGHDRHRRHRDGRGSHAEVRAALERMARFRPLFSGILCTIDLRNDPLATYEALGEWRPPAIDFLLPHGNWSAPPPGITPGSPATPYADWLIPIFDRWYRSPPRQPAVRLFGQILRLLLGGASTSESIGLSPMGLLFIETDGGIEQADTLKSSFEGAAATGLRVADDGFDAVLALPSMAAQQIGERALAAECRSCGVRRVCGGGLFAHRYRAGSGFANPSVFCADLFRLIDHIRSTVESDLAARRERLR